MEVNLVNGYTITIKYSYDSCVLKRNFQEKISSFISIIIDKLKQDLLDLEIISLKVKFANRVIKPIGIESKVNDCIISQENYTHHVENPLVRIQDNCTINYY